MSKKIFLKKFSLLIFLVIFLSFLFLPHLSFSAGGWVKIVGSEILSSQVIDSQYIIIGTAEGSIYSINKDSGKQKWKNTALNGSIKDLELFNNKIIAFSSNGIIYTISKNGVIISTEKLDCTFQDENVIGNEKIYIATEKGIAVKQNGIKWIYQESAQYTAPVEIGNKLFFGEDDKLVATDLNGNIIWSNENVGPFWNTQPKVYAGTVYIGSMNHRIYAISAYDGKEKWSFETNGAINSKLTIDSGTLYAGNMGGKLYAFDLSNGKEKWKANTNDGIFSKSISTTIGQKDVVLIGSMDSYVYGFSKSNGELIWGKSMSEPIKDVISSGNQIFALSKKQIYSIKTDRSCVILIPKDKSKIGYKETVISGKIFSKYDGASAKIKVNEGVTTLINVDEEGNFEYVLNPNLYPFGIVNVECGVSDQMGNSNSKESTTISLMRSNEFTQPKFNIDYPISTSNGRDITINIYDSENGELINNFEYKINGKGKTTIANKTITINSKEYNLNNKIMIEFSKIGYKNKKIIINIEEDYMMYIILVILLIIIGVGIWFKFIMKPRIVE